MCVRKSGRRKEPVVGWQIQLGEEILKCLWWFMHVINPHALIERTCWKGWHITTVRDYGSVAHFDLQRKIMHKFHHWFHFSHQSLWNRVVDDPETTTFLTCFSQLLPLLSLWKLLKIHHRNTSLHLFLFHLLLLLDPLPWIWFSEWRS